jgi:hypothetical protein
MVGYHPPARHHVHLSARAARRWLAFLAACFPDVLTLSQLRRDPHMLAWLCSL